MFGGGDFGLSAGVGGLLGGATSAADFYFQERASSEAARRQFQRTKVLYQNRYQWQVEDLRKAGLNPMLSYTHGPGSPGGAAMQQVPQADVSSGVQRGMEQGRASARQHALLQPEKRRAIADAKTAEWGPALAKETWYRTAAEGDRAKAAAAREQQEVLNLRAQERFTETQNRLLGTEIASAEAAEELYKKWPWLRQVREVLGAGGLGRVPTRRGARRRR